MPPQYFIVLFLARAWRTASAARVERITLTNHTDSFTFILHGCFKPRRTHFCSNKYSARASKPVSSAWVIPALAHAHNRLRSRTSLFIVRCTRGALFSVCSFFHLHLSFSANNNVQIANQSLLSKSGQKSSSIYRIVLFYQVPEVPFRTAKKHFTRYF